MVQKAQRILVVEDEYLLADDLRGALQGEGIIVLGPVASQEDAMALIDGGPIDGAILDINLNGRMVYPFARILRRRGVPFVFLTGYDDAVPDSGFADVALIQKPFTQQALEAAIVHLGAHQPLA